MEQEINLDEITDMNLLQNLVSYFNPFLSFSQLTKYLSMWNS